MATFKASTQYGDWEGTAAADSADVGAVSVSEYLRKKGLFKDDEFLMAIHLFVGENHNNKLSKPYIRAFVFEGLDKYEDVRARLEELESEGEPIPVREIKMELSATEFIAMFKRFDVMLTWHDLPLNNREYRVTNKG